MTLEMVFESLTYVAVMISSIYFIFHLGKIHKKENQIFFFITAVLFILSVCIILESYEYYTFMQNFSVALLLADIYTFLSVVVSFVIQRSFVTKVIWVFLWIVFIFMVYQYTTKVINKRFTDNESLKEIYLEVGAVLERKHTYMLLKKIKQCDKFMEIQKKRIELDKELLKNPMFNRIIQKYETKIK